MTAQLQRYRLIGISGKLGSGKSTLARYLQTLYPRMQRHSFAEKLREVLCCVTGLALDQTRTAAQKNAEPLGWNKSVGALLQDIGAALRERVHPDAWVLALFAEWAQSFEDAQWIVDDVRHVNEAERVRSEGGVLIRLEGDPADERARSTRNLQHESETALDEYAHFDVVIDTEQYINDWPGLVAEIERQLRERAK